jgi:hypothetical protein
MILSNSWSPMLVFNMQKLVVSHFGLAGLVERLLATHRLIEAIGPRSNVPLQASHRNLLGIVRSSCE